MFLSEEIKRLPVTEVYDRLAVSVAGKSVSILKAPPGSGKSTALPALFLHNNICPGKKILMLEPRRIACRMVAERIAFLLGEEVGITVG
jgi:ATP-dependent helicase HrpB